MVKARKHYKLNRRERAARLSKTCAGPVATVEDVQQKVSKTLSRLEQSLNFEKRDEDVGARRAGGGSGGHAAHHPLKRQKAEIPDVVNPKTPSQVDSLALFNYVEGLKTKTGRDKVNWSAVASSFNLNSNKAAISVYHRHCAVVE